MAQHARMSLPVEHHVLVHLVREHHNIVASYCGGKFIQRLAR